MSWLDTRPPEVIDAAVEKLRTAPGVQVEAVRDYAGGDLRFGVWLYLVNKRSLTVLTIGIFDLEDWNWRDAYDSGLSPKEAFANFVEELNLDELLDGE